MLQGHGYFCCNRDAVEDERHLLVISFEFFQDVSLEGGRTTVNNGKNSGSEGTTVAMPWARACAGAPVP